MSNKILHLIYLRTGEMLLSKKEYSHWEEIQDEYEHYMTDLAFDSCEDLISYFELDFGDESHWPFSKNELLHFINSDEVVLST